MEHPDYGIARVFFRWVESTHGGWTNEPYGVEFDLFTPDSEKIVLLELLLEEQPADRIDRSVSVSAFENENERSVSHG